MKLSEIYNRVRGDDYYTPDDDPRDDETTQINFELERCCIAEADWSWGKDGRINVNGEMWIPTDWQPTKMKPSIDFGFVNGHFCNDSGITTPTFEWLPHTCNGIVSLGLATTLKSIHQLPANINYKGLELDNKVMNLLALKKLKIETLVLYGDNWGHDGEGIPIGQMDIHQLQERLIEMGLNKQARL